MVQLLQVILKYASIDTGVRLVESMHYQAKELDTSLGHNKRTLWLLEAVFMFFCERWRQESCDEIKPTRYMTQHKRRMNIMLGKQAMQAM